MNPELVLNHRDWFRYRVDLDLGLRRLGLSVESLTNQIFCKCLLVC